MVCQRCGAQNERAARFCAGCGATLSAAVPAPTVALPVPPPPAPRSPKTGRSTVIALGIAVVVLVAAIGGGAWWYFQSNARSEADAQLAAASGYVRAALSNDYPRMSALIPPDTAAALPSDWFEKQAGGWSQNFVYTGTKTGPGASLTLIYGLTDSTLTVNVHFAVDSSAGDDAVVSMALRLGSDPAVIETSTLTLHRFDGSWLIARYQTSAFDNVFWRDGASTAEIVKALVTVPASTSPAAITPSEGAGLPPGHPSVVDTSTSSPGVASSNGSFDPATATRVPTGQAPRDFVAAYYQAILDKQWQKAFDMQPEASKTGQTVDAFQQTQEQMYGMKKFSIFSDATNGTDATVVAVQDLGDNGIWNATWTFVEDGGVWLVKSRAAAMGQPTK